jgi:hypothetical protein
MKTIKIFACYHTEPPQLRSDILLPLKVGADLSKTEKDVICDNVGDNISVKNPYFCELTGTYWIWKNVQADIVGICHYRRFFNLQTEDTKFLNFKSDFEQKYGLTEEQIEKKLEQYDLILPQKHPHRPKTKHLTIYCQYADCHIIKDLDIVLNILHEKYSDMFPLAERLLKKDRQMYVGNMLLCKKDLFDEYSKWLFDILFEVEKRIHQDVETRDTYQKRVYGFLSERLTRVFVEYKRSQNMIKVLEVPMLVQVGQYKWLKYCFRKMEKKILSVFSFKK